jgi:cysteine-rich repeat protein
MLLRARLLLLLLTLAGCSFIDDFDKFARRDAGDQLDAGGEEAGGGDAGDLPDADAAPEDGGAEDSGSEAAAEGGSGPGDELCADQTDGTPCGDDQQLICLKGFCRTSRCGDGFVNAARDEQCDDANLMRNDGCEPASCRYSCTTHADCDNGFACDGDELCDTRNHRCEPDPVPTTNKPCTRDGVAGVCNDKGYCVSPGCGDGVVGAGEQCDPLKVPATPGCRADCTQGCIDSAGCRDLDLCNGEETCETSSGECKPGVALACVDGDPCTEDGTCIAANGCTYPLLDGDGDLVSPATCATGSTHKGGDCNDEDPLIYPGATEYCDGVDNDCDERRDENVQDVTCYPDHDRDGYPNQQGGFSACSCPSGTRPERPDRQWDCWDDPNAGGGDVHPGQQAYFGEPYDRPCPSGNDGNCKSFDYDCSGMATPLYGAGPGMCNLLACSGEGYSGGVPACGANGNYLTCTAGLLRCDSKSETRRQVCH